MYSLILSPISPLPLELQSPPARRKASLNPSLTSTAIPATLERGNELQQEANHEQYQRLP